MSERTFTEHEIARILKRASELESEKGTSGLSSKGLTLDELASVATESGLDPELIKRAADEITNPDSHIKSAAKKGINGTTLFADCWLDFIPNQQSIDTIIADLDHRFRDSNSEFWHLFGKPKTKKKGKIIEWNHKDTWGSFETSILMQPVGKKYRISVNKRSTSGMNWENEFNFYFLFFGMFIAAGIVTSSYFLDFLWQAIALVSVLFAILFPQIKKYNSKRINKHLSQLETLLEEIKTNFIVSKEDFIDDSVDDQQIGKSNKKMDINPIWEESEPGPLKNNLRNKA